MRKILKLSVVAIIVVSASLSMSKNGEQRPILPLSLIGVEANAACETSSNSSYNYGHCIRDVNNSNEYCASGKGSPECNGTF